MNFQEADPGPEYRYCYWPFPGEADPGLEDPLADTVPRFVGALRGDDLLQVGPIRFELDHMNYDPGIHPLSHATIGAASSRIPVRGVMTPNQFMGFILRHYYPEAAGNHEEWMEVPRRKGWRQSLDELDGLPYFDWRGGRV